MTQGQARAAKSTHGLFVRPASNAGTRQSTRQNIFCFTTPPIETSITAGPRPGILNHGGEGLKRAVCRLIMDGHHRAAEYGWSFFLLAVAEAIAVRKC